MLYIEYYKQLKRYTDKLKELTNLLDKKEELFLKTQPGGIDYNKDHVQGHEERMSAMEAYVIKMEMEEIDKNINELKPIITDRYFVLKQIEKDLINSKEIDDRIYVLYTFNKYSYRKISKIVHYSKSAVGNIMDKISENLSKI